MRKKRTWLVMIALVFSAVASAAQDAKDFKAIWRSEVNLGQIGNGDLRETYGEVLDYLFPRSPSYPRIVSATIVLRFVFPDKPEHQLNISIQGDKLNPKFVVWSLEAPIILFNALNSSENGKNLVNSTKITVRQIVPSPRLIQLLKDRMGKGFEVGLRQQITFDGESYDLWADWASTQLEVHQTVPSAASDGLTKWMHDVWLASREGIPR